MPVLNRKFGHLLLLAHETSPITNCLSCLESILTNPLKIELLSTQHLRTFPILSVHIPWIVDHPDEEICQPKLNFVIFLRYFNIKVSIVGDTICVKLCSSSALTNDRQFHFLDFFFNTLNKLENEID